MSDEPKIPISWPNVGTLTLPDPTMPQPKLSLTETVWQCFVHFVHLDLANASIHCAPVRYSPLTFRLAEHLWGMAPSMRSDPILADVVNNHLGNYQEDAGR